MSMSLKKAAIFNFISKYGSMLVQFALTLVLARLITPEAYGTVSILLIILNFLSLIADMGLGISIIQHPEMTKEEQDSLFSFTCLLGIGTFLIMILSSFPLVSIYHNEDYKILCPLISIAGFFNALNIVPNAALTRDKRFDVIALRTILSASVPGIIAIIMAVFHAGVYALVFQAICSSMFLFVWNYWKRPFKICRFDFHILIHLMGAYSLFQFVFNILNYFTRNLDNLMIGAEFGDAQLGYYNKAYTLYLYPNILFTSIITGVLHPYIRDYRNDYSFLLRKVLEVMQILSVTGIYMMLICFSCANEIILIVFGNQWSQAVPCFKMLSLCIWTSMLSSVAGSVFLGVERTDQTLKCGIINIIIMVVAIFAGMSKGSIEIVSLYVSVAYNIIFFITYYILIQCTLGGSVIEFLSHFFLDFLFVGIGTYIFTLIQIPDSGILGGFVIKAAIISGGWILYLIATNQMILIRSIIAKSTTK